MVETIHPGAAAPDARVAIFDFDGTLSLIRTGWMNVMVPMMIEILADLRTGETGDQLRAVIEDFVWRLTGKETLYQMIELAGQRRDLALVPLAEVSQLASSVAAEIGYSPGTARRELVRYVRGLQAGPAENQSTPGKEEGSHDD